MEPTDSSHSIFYQPLLCPVCSDKRQPGKRKAKRDSSTSVTSTEGVRDSVVTSRHSIAFANDGNVIVSEWNRIGYVLRRNFNRQRQFNSIRLPRLEGFHLIEKAGDNLRVGSRHIFGLADIVLDIKEQRRIVLGHRFALPGIRVA